VINIRDKRLDKFHPLRMDKTHNRLVPQVRAGEQSSVREEAACAKSGLVGIHNS
jgi:hypothetical protein